MGICLRPKIIFCLWVLIAAAPHVLHAYQGEGALKATGHSIASGTKGISKGVVWTGKELYKGVEYIVTELFRPIRPITNKMVDWFGVTVEEE